MIDKKQNIGFWGMFIIFLVVIAFIALLSLGGKGNTQTYQPSVPVYTAENCIHDLAIRNANAVKKDMDSGVPFSETKEINRLSEYERQKTECYKNFK